MVTFMFIDIENKVDSLPGFPRSAVHPDTETRLTLEFGKGSSEPRPYGRPEF